MTQLSEHLTAEDMKKLVEEFMAQEGLDDNSKTIPQDIIDFGVFMLEHGYQWGDDNGYIRASEESKEN